MGQGERLHQRIEVVGEVPPTLVEQHHVDEGVGTALMEVGRAQTDVPEAGHFELAAIGRKSGGILATVILGWRANPDVVEAVVGEQRRHVAGCAVRHEHRAALLLAWCHRQRITGHERVERSLIRDEFPFVGREGHRDARGGDAGVTEGRLKELRVGRTGHNGRLHSGGDGGGETKRSRRHQFGGEQSQRRSTTPHLARGRRQGGLGFQGAVIRDDHLLGHRIQKLGADSAVPERLRIPSRADRGRGLALRHLGKGIEDRIRKVEAVRIAAHDSARTARIVRGPEQTVSTRMQIERRERARIAATDLGAMAGATRHGVVPPELLLPKQDLAQHDLVGVGGILDRMDHRRNRLGEQRAQECSRQTGRAQ